MANEPGSPKKQFGNYVVERTIGTGGFATVYLGRHIIFENIVAIKELRAKEQDSPDQYRHFLQEARILYQLKHPHILPIIDSGIENGVPYLITEYATNDSLATYLRKHRPTIEEAIDMLSQIGQALQFAHQQEPCVVHHDIKPDNILFNAKGQALLADFGIAEFLSAAKTVSVTGIFGTYAYMAPEQFDYLVSPKSDQYSFGCVAYELFTGKRPFDLPPGSHNTPLAWYGLHSQKEPLPLTQLNPDVPAHVEQAVLKAMAKQREHRHADISAFLTALGAETAGPDDITIPNIMKQDAHASLASTFYEARASNPFQKTIAQWLHDGEICFEEQRYSDALIAYDQVTRLDSKNAEAFYRMGKVLEKLNHHVQALVAYERAIALNPSYAEAYIGQGDVHFDNEPEEALVFYRKATSLDRRNALGYYKMGNVYLKLHKYALALEAYEDATTFSPRFMDAHYAKIKVLLELKRSDEAIEAYDEIIQLGLASMDTYQQKAMLLRQLKRREEAVAVYNHILTLDPHRIDIYKKKITVLQSLRQDQAILATYNQLIQHNPDFVEAYYEKAALLEQLRHYQEAKETYNQLIPLTNNNEQLKSLKGRVLTLNVALTGEKIQPALYAVALNPLLIPLLAGLLLHSFPYAFLTLVVEIILTVAIYYYALSNENPFLGALSAIVFAGGWAWICGLLLPSATSVVIGFLISCLIELFLYAFIVIYNSNDLFNSDYLLELLASNRPLLPPAN